MLKIKYEQHLLIKVLAVQFINNLGLFTKSQRVRHYTTTVHCAFLNHKGWVAVYRQRVPIEQQISNFGNLYMSTLDLSDHHQPLAMHPIWCTICPVVTRKILPQQASQLTSSGNYTIKAAKCCDTLYTLQSDNIL